MAKKKPLPEKVPMTLHQGKTAIETQGYECQPVAQQGDAVAVRCPECGDRNGVFPGTPARCRCGAVLLAKK